MCQILRLFTVLTCHMQPFLHKKNHYFSKEFLDKIIFYSVRTFARIKQHYFSKYWGNQCMGRPPTSNFGGDRPPKVSAPGGGVVWYCAEVWFSLPQWISLLHRTS